MTRVLVVFGEAIVDRESGLLVPPRDEQAISDALNLLLDDRARAARMGALAFQRVSRRFTLTAMTRGMADVYSEVAMPTSRQRSQSDSTA